MVSNKFPPIRSSYSKWMTKYRRAFTKTIPQISSPTPPTHSLHIMSERCAARRRFVPRIWASSAVRSFRKSLHSGTSEAQGCLQVRARLASEITGHMHWVRPSFYSSWAWYSAELNATQVNNCCYFVFTHLCTCGRNLKSSVHTPSCVAHFYFSGMPQLQSPRTSFTNMV